MSDLKQINNAENHLIVGSLEVLGDIEGSSMKTIKRTVSKLAESVQATNTAMENYWGGIGADNIVTPAEKEILYSKWQTLEQTFTAIRKIATDREITDTADYITLHELYDNLHDYIFNELKLFDEMDSKTVLPDTEHFNELFENYYKQQINFQSILSSTTTTIRTVSNLNAAGTENEVVIYKNRFFKYSNGKWVSFDSPEYEGVLEELPEDIINHYFVAGKQGGFRDTFKIKVNKKYLVNEDEQYVTVSSKLFEYGYIYVYTQYNGWQKVTDKNNWRYTVALNDLIANNIPISTELENYLQAKEDSAVERANQNTNTAISNIHTPVNLGALTSFPPSRYGKNDWFLWKANDTTGTYTYNETTNTILLKKGYVYKFYNDVWNRLEWRDNTYNTSYYMGFLKEILQIMGADTTTEYFGTVFVDTLLAAKAFIDNLFVNSVKSNNWESSNGEEGFYLNGETGQFYCMGGVFKGDIVTDCLKVTESPTNMRTATISPNEDFETLRNRLLDGTEGKNNFLPDWNYNISGTMTRNNETINLTKFKYKINTKIHKYGEAYNYEYGSPTYDLGLKKFVIYRTYFRKELVNTATFWFNDIEYYYEQYTIYQYYEKKPVEGDYSYFEYQSPTYHNFFQQIDFSATITKPAGKRTIKLFDYATREEKCESHEIYIGSDGILRIKQ